jgi:hypothetical protein
MSVLTLWLSRSLWGWDSMRVVLGITFGVGLLVAGIVRLFSEERDSADHA